ncbi:hypothetical protein [uncultured Cellulomonas sp.]|uniref:hypothetical protein n=1 Tax=uncultured Cellulomonas sp. TaxID=189682 RepID=UPI0026074EE6|nr:hypothetical protein [uncultured Cellulomonas sp.]
MDACTDTLVIELEHCPRAGARGAPSARPVPGDAATVLRFVARRGGRLLYVSPPFPGPRPGEGGDPREDVAPGMNRALHTLRRDIQRDGWIACGRGAHPWAVRFERPAAAGRTDGRAALAYP